MMHLAPFRASAAAMAVGGSLIAALPFALFSRPAHAAAATDLVIRATATSFQVGRDNIYTVSVTNNGPAATDEDVHVTSALPNGLSFTSNRGTGWSCSALGQVVDCVRSDSLPAGQSSSLVVGISVCTAAFPSVTTSFHVEYAGDTNALNNVARRTTVVKSGVCANTPTPTAVPGAPTRTRTPSRTPTPTQTPAPAASDLSITKFTAGTFVVGATGIYTLTVANLGPASTNTVITVTDALPNGLGLVSASGSEWSCTLAGTVVVCTRAAPLVVGSSSVITLTVSIDRAAYPSVTNTANLAYAGDTNAANNISRRPTTLRILPQRPGGVTATPTPSPRPVPTATPTAISGGVTPTDLSLTKAAAGPIVVGTTGAYILTVRNLGAAATNAPMTTTDTLPTGLTFVSADPPLCQASGQSVVCVDDSPLPAGGLRTIRLNVAVGAAAFPSVTNSATLVYAGDTNSRNNTALRPTTVRR